MSRSTSDVVAAIDGALDDWQVSGDAMRWTPDAPSEAPWEPMLGARYVEVNIEPQIEAFIAAMASTAEVTRRLSSATFTFSRRFTVAAHRIGALWEHRRQRNRKGKR